MSDAEEPTDTLMHQIAAAPLVRPAGVFTGTERFELRGRMGEGGFGTVFRALDRERGELVALKLLRRTAADDVYRFKREFRIAADLDHPNVIPLHGLFTVGEHWFFTMPLIDGRPLHAWLDGSEARLRDALGQLASALAALHGVGIIHRDVKPSNALVEPDGRVVLLDLGLARSMTDGESTVVAGTPRYMSPEQCAGRPIGPACDAYALGVLLFEALARQAPFDGTSRAVVAAKISRDAPPLAAVAPDAPADLAALTDRLLARAPDERPTLAQVVEALRPGARPSTEREGLRFVGRSAEVEATCATLAAAAPGRPTAVVIQGLSGIGKSALLDECLRRTRRQHPAARIFVGRCHPNEAVPYRTLDALMDQVARQLERRPEVEAAACLPTDPQALALLFPVFGLLPSLQIRAPAPGSTPTTLLARASDALREMLTRMATMGRVVLALEDVHWGDADSADLLRRALSPPAAPGISIVATTQRVGDEDDPLVRALVDLSELNEGLTLRRLPLGPLTPTDAAALARAAQGEASAPIADLLASAGGSPFFIIELARLGAAVDAVDVGALVERHLRDLGADARAVLGLVVTAGYPVAPALLAAAGGIEANVETCLDQLAARRLVRRVTAAGRPAIIAWHAQVTAAVLGGHDGERRRALHLALASALEQMRDADPERLAHHYEAAGDAGRAAGYALSAAERAMNTLAFERAAELWRRISLLDPARQRPRVLEGLGDALAATGRATEAAEIYLEAATVVTGERTRALRCRAGSLLLLSGQIERGRAVLAGELRRYGGILSASTALLIWRALTDGLRARFQRPRDVEPTPEDLELLDALWAAGSGSAISDPLVGIVVLTRHRIRARRVQAPIHRGRALALEAIDLSMRGGDGAQLRCQRLLADLRAAPGAAAADPGLNALRLAAEGMVAAMAFRFDDACRLLPAARRAAYDAGQLGSYGADAAALTYSSVLFEMGDIPALRAVCPALLEEMDHRGHLIGWTLAKMHYAQARLYGDGDVSLIQADLASVEARWAEATSGSMQQWWLAIARAMARLHDGRSGEAWDAIKGTREATRRLFSTRFLRFSGLHVRGRIALARAVDDAAARRPMLREVRRCARPLLAARHPWPRALGLALSAGAATLNGDPPLALALLSEADPLFDAGRLKLLRATADLARARLLGDVEGAPFRERATEWLEANDVRGVALALRSLLPGRWG